MAQNDQRQGNNGGNQGQGNSGNQGNQGGNNSNRGFASMDDDQQKEIASRGGKARMSKALHTSSIQKRLAKQVAKVEQHLVATSRATTRTITDKLRLRPQ